mmetsp:Transcript_108452/g.324315  ORF Transcript_108452/g.324315 Transcript_108452/m.324315 type:complete len:208 (+) Transcript_108452:1588-2211(+)
MHLALRVFRRCWVRFRCDRDLAVPSPAISRVLTPSFSDDPSPTDRPPERLPSPPLSWCWAPWLSAGPTSSLEKRCDGRPRKLRDTGPLTVAGLPFTAWLLLVKSSFSLPPESHRELQRESSRPARLASLVPNQPESLLPPPHWPSARSPSLLAEATLRRQRVSNPGDRSQAAAPSPASLRSVSETAKEPLRPAPGRSPAPRGVSQQT